MIKIKNISKSFNNQIILDNLSLEVQKGEVISLIGSSGAGKSTFLRSLNYLEQPDNGTLQIENSCYDFADISTQQVLDLRGKTAMVFQSFNLFKRKTALENVAEALIVVQKIPQNEAFQIAFEELTKVGLKERVHHYPQHLSGGQQQRVAIARAIALKPQLLLLDEPTSALDPELVGEVLNIIKTLAQEGQTMILVSHEMDFVYEVSTKVLFLEKGKILEQGTPYEVFYQAKNERTREFLKNSRKNFEPEFFI